MVCNCLTALEFKLAFIKCFWQYIILKVFHHNKSVAIVLRLSHLTGAALTVDCICACILNTEMGIARVQFLVAGVLWVMCWNGQKAIGQSVGMLLPYQTIRQDSD